MRGTQRDASALSPTRRSQALTTLETEVLDLLVVGAGATGCGTALDAASRGLKVGLIEKDDIASGTSSRSSCLVHGGLRYLQQGNVALVRESLRERSLLLTTLAPHLVEPLAFVFPLEHHVWQRAMVGAGLGVYDVLGNSRAVPRHAHLGRAGLARCAPDINTTRFIGGLRYYDARMDDARLTVALARTAAAHGAHVATHTSLQAGIPDSGDGIVRVLIRDELTGRESVVAARAVALCVGVWAPALAARLAAALPGADETPTDGGVHVAQSKGVHLRLPRSAIRGDDALIVPNGRSVLFVIPNPDHWLVGTTDTAWSGNPDEVGVSEDDIEYLLGQLAGVLAREVDRSEVTYTFAGLRPLAADTSVGGDSAKVSREHRITRVRPGILAIVGGKWTTYRCMARDVVDAALAETGKAPLPCPTATIPLTGADGTGTRIPDAYAALEHRYGTRAGDVLSLMTGEAGLGDGLEDGPGYWHADVVAAIRYEGAMSLSDILDRRLRVGRHLESVSAGLIADAGEVAARELGWDEAETARQTRAYAQTLEHSS